MLTQCTLTAVAALAAQAPLAGYDLHPNNVDFEAITGGVAVVYHQTEWPNLGFKPRAPWDWSKARALEFDIRNRESSPQVLGVRFDDDPSADGWHHTRTGTVTVGGGKAEHVAIVFGPDPMSVGMRGVPPVGKGLNASATGDGSFKLDHVTALQFFLHDIKSDVRLEITNIRLNGESAGSMAGIVDAFGQYTGADWLGKVHSVADLTRQKSAEADGLRNAPAMPNRDRFGGTLSLKALKPTGFFSTAKVDGKWWLVDPDGRLFFSFGVDCVQPDESTFITGRESMFTWMPNPSDPLVRFRYHTGGIHSGPVKEGDVFNFYGANLYRKWGDDYLKVWRELSLARLPAWGFNTIGNWSEEAFIRNGKVPYVATGGIGGEHARLSSGSDYWSTMHDPFDPQFKTDVQNSLTHLVSLVKGDSSCVGYFIDNELSWAGDGPDGRYGLGLGALKAQAGSPGKVALIDQLEKKYGSIAGLNTAWGTAYADWDTLLRPVASFSLSDGSRKDLSIYVHRLALKYFSTIRDELKRQDPDHLYLGCRFAWYGPEAEQAASEACDVVSYNIYAPKLDEKQWSHVTQLNKPCIIGEFHFGSLDRGMFHPGLVSAPNQAARAAMYEDYVGSVLRHPAFVGCHWFQYADEPLTGRAWDGENYNIGMVSVTDTPYPEMIEAAKHIHRDGYLIRAGKQPINR